MNEKIAISTDGDQVAPHFGRCPSYTLFEINEKSVANKEVIDNPGHEPGFLPVFLAERGVTCIIAGGMGPRAQMLFGQRGIESIIGITGKVDEVIETYLRGELESGESMCEH